MSCSQLSKKFNILITDVLSLGPSSYTCTVVKCDWVNFILIKGSSSKQKPLVYTILAVYYRYIPYLSKHYTNFLRKKQKLQYSTVPWNIFIELLSLERASLFIRSWKCRWKYRALQLCCTLVLWVELHLIITCFQRFEWWVFHNDSVEIPVIAQNEKQRSDFRALKKVYIL